MLLYFRKLILNEYIDYRNISISAYKICSPKRTNIVGFTPTDNCDKNTIVITSKNKFFWKINWKVKIRNLYLCY